MRIPRLGMAALGWILPGIALASGDGAFAGPQIGSIPLEFIFFGCVLAGVAFFHHYTLRIALGGAVLISFYKILFSPFKTGVGLTGFIGHAGHEWVTLSNLFLLLLGFALLADYFEKSELPAALPNIMPGFMPTDWRGCFMVLLLVFVLSGFLDNIAAAMIGGALANTVFKGRVHIGFLAALVAASNAGGAGSVVGDTTTTMMWIAGVPPTEVVEAYIASAVALVIFGVPAAVRQNAYQPIDSQPDADVHIDWTRVGVVVFILVAAVAVNVTVNSKFNAISDRFPFLGAAVWVAVLLMLPLRRPTWSLLPGAAKGAIFLLSLVWCASMMPVDRLPLASWQTALGLGFLSAVFDNIPLTALALKQGGYDWGFLAYAVGFGGSMIWFGSSAGVAVANMFPQARSVGLWLRHGWFIPVAYVIGFFVMLAAIGFHPGSTPRGVAPVSAPAAAASASGG